MSKDGTNSTEPKDNNSFSMKWKPGVKIGGEWMMEYLSINSAHDSPEADMMGNSYPEHIRNLSEKYPDKISELVCAIFKSNVHETTHVDLNWPIALKTSDRDAAHANLKSMFLSRNPIYKVTVWFLSPVATTERFNEGGAHLLVDGVEEHSSPFYQYLDDNDEPMMSFNMPSINAIGNGIYRKLARAQKVAQGRCAEGAIILQLAKDSIVRSDQDLQCVVRSSCCP